MASVAISSSAAVLALLEEDDVQLKVHALQWIHRSVDQFWAEVASSIDTIEQLYEDPSFPQRPLAASVASKLYYHLEELDDALKYALGADDLFDISEPSEYIHTLLSQCIDKYALSKSSNNQVDLRLEHIVETMFQRCFTNSEYKQAIGIALETFRLDKLEQAISLSSDPNDLLDYTLSLSQTVVQNKSFRSQLLHTLVSLYKTQSNPNHQNICQCLFYLNDAQSIADLLSSLLESPNNAYLTAFQVAFALCDNQNQPFLLRISNSLPQTESLRMSNLRQILSGTAQTDLTLQFLYAQSASDAFLMKFVKEKLDTRNSTTHNAAILAHAFMNSGSTRDQFVRDNLEWLGRASNWSKFSATACFGIIHQGHLKKSFQLMEPYLPEDGSASPYLSGGALYGLGLIHANCSGDITQFLIDRTRSSNEIVQHGACLGIGLNALATGSLDTLNALKEVLYQDNAVSGEAAGLSMGLVMLGQSFDGLHEMLSYARDTKHEKIIRGLGLGMALCMYAQEESSWPFIDQLLLDKDPILRYSGCYAIALAFVGSDSNQAVRKLLHLAVSDVSNDVRRAAVISIGFVLCKTPEQVPRVVSLLADSYNPYVRYASAFAVGLACAGTASVKAKVLLDKLLQDRVDYVRQAALISMAMVMMQVSGTENSYVIGFRERLLNLISGKLTDSMTKLGAVVAQGILDAGGRNVTIALVSANGHKRMSGIVVIGLTGDLRMPKSFNVVSNAVPSMFGYPEPFEEDKQVQVEQSYNAVLSISAKAKARAAVRRKEGDSMPLKDPIVEDVPMVPMEEESFQVLMNPCRVTVSQRRVISVPKDQRYVPVCAQSFGFVMLEDKCPGEAEDLIAPEQFKTLGVGEEEEPLPPSPFEFTR